MRIKVQVVPRASRNAIEKLGEEKYKVWVTALPVKGQANKAVIKLLAWELGVLQSSINLTSGYTSKNKTFKID